MTKYYKKWREFLTEREVLEPDFPDRMEYTDEAKAVMAAQQQMYRDSYTISDDPSVPHGASAQVWLKDIKERYPELSDDEVIDRYKNEILPGIESALEVEPEVRDPAKNWIDARATGGKSGIRMGPRHQPYIDFNPHETTLQASNAWPRSLPFAPVFGHETAHVIDARSGQEGDPGDSSQAREKRRRYTKHGDRISDSHATAAWRQRDKFELAFPGISDLNLDRFDPESSRSPTGPALPHALQISEPYADILQLRALYNKQHQQGLRSTPFFTGQDMKKLKLGVDLPAVRGSAVGGDLGELINTMKKPGLSDQDLADILNTIAMADTPERPMVTEKLIFDKWRNYLKEEKKVDSNKIAKAVICDGNKVLLLKRSAHLKKHAGEWDLPGGHILEGEDAQDGLQREVWEETGLMVRRPEKLYSQGRNTYYKARLPQKRVSLSSEHVDYKMVDIRDLENYNLSSKYIDAVRRAYK